MTSTSAGPARSATARCGCGWYSSPSAHWTRREASRADQHREGARARKLDPSISRAVQPNYIKRPHWVEHPDRDVLGDIPTIGWVKGTHEYLAVPDDLTHRRAGRQAQGHNVDIADHPDAETAVRGIG